MRLRQASRVAQGKAAALSYKSSDECEWLLPCPGGLVRRSCLAHGTLNVEIQTCRQPWQRRKPHASVLLPLLPASCQDGQEPPTSFSNRFSVHPTGITLYSVPGRYSV